MVGAFVIIVTVVFPNTFFCEHDAYDLFTHCVLFLFGCVSTTIARRSIGCTLNHPCLFPPPGGAQGNANKTREEYRGKTTAAQCQQDKRGADAQPNNLHPTLPAKQEKVSTVMQHTI